MAKIGFGSLALGVLFGAAATVVVYESLVVSPFIESANVLAADAVSRETVLEAAREESEQALDDCRDTVSDAIDAGESFREAFKVAREAIDGYFAPDSSRSRDSSYLSGQLATADLLKSEAASMLENVKFTDSGCYS